MSCDKPEDGARDYVVAVGRRAARGAAILSERLSRPMLDAHDASEAEALITRDGVRSALVVAEIELVDRLVRIADASDLRIGLVSGRGSQELAAGAARLLDCRFSSSASSGRLVLDALGQEDEPKLSADADGTLWLGGRLSSDQLETCLTSAKQLLVLRAHSDGFSMLLGDFVLCAALASAEAGSGQGFPPQLPCFSTGWCGRLDGEMTELALAGRLIRADAVQADVLVNLGCYGAMLPPRSDWARSMGAALARSRVGQMLTCAGQVDLSPSDVRQITGALADGRTLGEALQVLRHLLRARGGPALALLLGDPAFVLEPRPVLSAETAGALPKKPERTECKLPRPAKTGDVYRFAAMLEAGDKDYEVSPGTPNDAICDRVLDRLADRAKRLGSLIMHSWLPWVEPEPREVAWQPCPNCGDLATLRSWAFRDQMVPDRSLLVCIGCGPVGDFPAAARPSRVERADPGRLCARFPDQALARAEAVVELWPRTLSQSWRAVCHDDLVWVEIDRSHLETVASQRAIVAIFAWSLNGLHLHRYPLQTSFDAR